MATPWSLLSPGDTVIVFAGPHGVQAGQFLDVKFPDRPYMVPLIAQNTAKPGGQVLARLLPDNRGTPPHVVTLDAPEQP